MDDSWQSAAAYDRYMGRWSRLISQKFLRWLAVPPAQRWLDVGCGTGTLTRLILETSQPQAVTAIDSSKEFIEHTRHTIPDPRAEFRVSLAQALDVGSHSVDAAVSGLVLNFVPQPEEALREMLRVTRPGGTAGVFVWDYANGMQMLRYFFDAAIALDPGAQEWDEGALFPVCQEGQLERFAREAGWKDVEAAALEVLTVFQNFDDFWQPFSGKVGVAPRYLMTLEPPARQKLADKLREMLPTAADGTIPLTAKAWAVKGRA